MHLVRPFSAIAVGILLSLAGCTILGLDANQDDEDSLRIAREHWRQQRPTEYSYTLERLCFCGQEAVGPVRIVVRGDSVLSRTYTASSQPVTGQFAGLFGTIDALFEDVAEAIERDPDSLSARYDAGRGYPIRVAIDFVRNAVDDELTLRVSDFLSHDLTINAGARAQSLPLTGYGRMGDSLKP